MKSVGRGGGEAVATVVRRAGGRAPAQGTAAIHSAVRGTSGL
jgi:hypothetical protein